MSWSEVLLCCCDAVLFSKLIDDGGRMMDDVQSTRRPCRIMISHYDFALCIQGLIESGHVISRPSTFHCRSMS